MADKEKHLGFHEMMQQAQLKTGSVLENKIGRCSRIQSQPLYDSALLSQLAGLRRICESSYGPVGRLKFLQNSSGGHVMVTSSSSRLLHGLLPESHPVIRLIISAVRSHLDLLSDGGLSTAILLLSLIETSIKLDVPRNVVVQVNSYALQVIMEHLNSPSCPWRLKIDFGDMGSMLSVVRSVVITKPACCLADKNIEFITVLLLKAFLQTLPSPSQATKPPPVNFVLCEGNSIEESKVVQGVLLEAYNPPISHQTENRTVKVALYNISMAGDSEELFSDVKLETTAGSTVTHVTDGTLTLMTRVINKLIDMGVGLLACQKCIHPLLKQNLAEKGIIVIDRLSILHIGSVHQVTGASIQSTFTTDIDEACLGCISKLEYVFLNGKSFIHILPGESDEAKQVTTVVLCSPDETTLEELKCVSNAAISVLSNIMACPYMLPGAGCTDTHLAALLRHKISHCDEHLLEHLGCTKGQYSTVINNVASCLETGPRNLEHSGGGHVTDSTNQHHWSIPPNMDPSSNVLIGCCCGLVDTEPEMQWCMMGFEQDNSNEKQDFSCGKNNKNTFDNVVLDSLTMRLSSFRVAFETANRILRVNYLVYDNT